MTKYKSPSAGNNIFEVNGFLIKYHDIIAVLERTEPVVINQETLLDESFSSALTHVAKYEFKDSKVFKGINVPVGVDRVYLSNELGGLIRAFMSHNPTLIGIPIFHFLRVSSSENADIAFKELIGVCAGAARHVFTSDEIGMLRGLHRNVNENTLGNFSRSKQSTLVKIHNMCVAALVPVKFPDEAEAKIDSVIHFDKMRFLDMMSDYICLDCNQAESEELGRRMIDVYSEVDE